MSHLELKVLVLEGANPILIGSQVGTCKILLLYSTEEIKGKLVSFFVFMCAARISYTTSQEA